MTTDASFRLGSSLDRMRVSTSTPDERAFAELRGRSEVRVRLAPGYFRQASASDLEVQLGRLARLLFVARMREYYRIRSADFGYTVTGERPSLGRQDREYDEARAALAVEGGDPRGLVQVSAIGMERWSVRIARDLFETATEETLCQAAGEAASRLVVEQFAQIAALKHRIYTWDD